MGNRGTLPILALATLLVGANASEAQVDPCADLTGAESMGDSLGMIAYLFGPAPPPAPDGLVGEAEYWVAKQPGVFDNVSCNETVIEAQEMYPIGTVVRPIGFVKLEKFEDNGKQPFLVLTEFGHRKIVFEGSFTPITQNVTYLFADGSDPIRICRTAEGCIGNSPDVCGDVCSQELSAFWGYALVGSMNADFQRAREAYIHLKASDALVTTPPATAAELDRYMADVCGPFGVQTFMTGGSRHYPESRDPSHLTFCAEPATSSETPGLATIKMVDLDYARDRFAGLLSGSFHRRFGADLPDTVSFRAFMEKPCGVKITDTSGAGFEFTAGFDIRKMVSLGATGTISREWTRTTTVADDEYLLVLTYFMETPFDADLGQQRPLKVFRIISKSGCNGSTIVRPISIEFQYEGEGRVTTSANFDAAKQGDLVQGYIGDNSVKGLTASSDPNYLRQGWFWRVRDHVAYYLWRDHLRRVLTEDVPEFELLLRGFNDDREKVLVRDFFVHLALSASFFHDDPCTKANVICE